jgi:uncharacterized protein YkvS
MANAIDMEQLLARVRENSGYKMDLTIIGNFQDYELDDIPLNQKHNYAMKWGIDKNSILKLIVIVTNGF